MGVKGLWTLLGPVGRPVLLETVEGKSMAVDSSIWLYQFQATMRDKDGRGLVNAHVLGFLRRILKLLFYGIRPVFVFDGGAPVLKRMTINSRKQKKSGAAASHAKIAEKLLAAQMRREALNHAGGTPASTSKGKGKAKAVVDGEVIIDESTVYPEEVHGSETRTPARPAPTSSRPSSASAKKARFHDHDPYRLPDVNLEEAVAKANSRTSVPDPRLATEEELQAFIDDMRPEDFDVTSEAFRDLPTEVQYEIVGDLRLKSRQTSYKRLQQMLAKAATPIDFSRQQIMNLKQRNVLTQQLLTTTDSIGKASLAMPVRIASERNREYVLVKNEGPNGGWVLGIRDDGTAAKPIVIDHEEVKKEEGVDDASDMDMEEVHIPDNESTSAQLTMDPDLREYQRSLALSAIADRYSPNKLAPLTTRPPKRSQGSSSLALEEDEDDEMAMQIPHYDQYEEDEAEDLAFAIQESMKQKPVSAGPRYPSNAIVGPSGLNRRLSDDYNEPTRLDNYSTFANTGTARKTSNPSPIRPSMFTTPSRKTSFAFAEKNADGDEDMFGAPTLLLEASSTPSRSMPPPSLLGVSESPRMNRRALQAVTTELSPVRTQVTRPSSKGKEKAGPPPVLSPPKLAPLNPMGVTAPSPEPTIAIPLHMSSDEDEMKEVVPVLRSPPSMRSASPLPQPSLPPSPKRAMVDSEDDMEEVLPTIVQPRPSSIPSPTKPEVRAADISDDDGSISGWSRSPSPTAGGSSAKEPRPEEEDWDAAHEMDPQAEEGEFARFVSQVKGKKIEDARKEIDEEIKTLNQQKKLAMRDSDDITQQMVSQIMLLLRLFGIPYITAPMEAEAQCAELVTLGLVDGIITDDSDVFLFGGLRVFKNMFNQSKTVECFLTTDLSRELGLDRDTLVRLAFLLGSDYVEGLPGVGPVVAMELLKEFPGEDGLHKFKDWWTRVQTGKDKDNESSSAFRKRFKKKFKDLFLNDEWPNSAVRDAYYHPEVDHSEEPFKWGMPDLDAIREFCREELGWAQGKVDELLVPIISKMGKRTQVDALNKQSSLNSYFDISAGMGTYAPRKRQAYSSKRLQQVVSDFRKLNGRSPPPEDDSEDEEDEGAPPKKKARKAAPKKARAGASKCKPATTTRGKGRGGRGGGRGGKRKKAVSEDEASEDEYRGDVEDEPVPAKDLRPRPKPRPIRKQVQAQKDEDEDEDEVEEHPSAEG